MIWHAILALLARPASHTACCPPAPVGPTPFMRKRLSSRVTGSKSHAINSTSGAATLAFIFAGRDANGEIVDVVALDPAADRAATLLGRVGVLGLTNLRSPRMMPPMTHASVSGWLRAARDGLVILDERLAAEELAAVTIGAPTREAGRALRARLAPHSRQAPQIVVPQIEERRLG